MESQGRETWLATFRFVFGVQVPCEEEGVLKCSQHIDPADPLDGISGPRLGKDHFERLAHRPLRTAVKGSAHGDSTARGAGQVSPRSHALECVNTKASPTLTKRFLQQSHAATSFVTNFPSSGAK